MLRPPENPVEDKVIRLIDRRSVYQGAVALERREARLATGALRDAADAIQDLHPAAAEDRRRIALKIGEPF